MLKSNDITYFIITTCIICCFNKKKTILKEEKVTQSNLISVTYGEFILDLALINISDRHF
jgi:hypothetical protein